MSQQQGNDMAAPNSKPAQSQLESAQGTVEDNLKDFLNTVEEMVDSYADIKHESYYPAIKEELLPKLQAIITTETTKAVLAKLEELAAYDWTEEDLETKLHESIKALQKEQKG